MPSRDIYGGDVSAGSGGIAVVSVSGLAGGSERARRGDGGASGDGADVSAGCGGDESGGDSICKDVGSGGWGMDFSYLRDFCNGLDGDGPRQDCGRQASNLNCLDVRMSSRHQQIA